MSSKKFISNRVVHIMSGYGGGISSFIENKASELADKKIIFDVITFDTVPNHFNETIETTGGKVYKVANPKKDGLNKFYKAVNKIFSEQPKDALIHSHVNGFKALPFYLIAKKNGLKRFAIHAHTSAPLANNSFQLKLRQRFNSYISKEKISCGIKATENIFGNESANEDNIMHIPNSINDTDFLNNLNKNSNKERLRNEILDITDNRIVIGSIARFRKLKNHKFMLDIIESLQNSGTQFLWFFAGDGLLKEEIENQIKIRGLEESIRFLGYRTDITNLFNIMDIFVLPSFHEGLPTVLIESQASSTYSLVSDRITSEADLGLGLVKYLSIDDADIWTQEIINFNEKPTSNEQIKQKLTEHKFTNKSSAELYLKFLQNKIDRYYI